MTPRPGHRSLTRVAALPASGRPNTAAALAFRVSCSAGVQQTRPSACRGAIPTRAANDQPEWQLDRFRPKTPAGTWARARSVIEQSSDGVFRRRQCGRCCLRTNRTASSSRRAWLLSSTSARAAAGGPGHPGVANAIARREAAGREERSRVRRDFTLSIGRLGSAIWGPDTVARAEATRWRPQAPCTTSTWLVAQPARASPRAAASAWSVGPVVQSRGGGWSRVPPTAATPSGWSVSRSARDCVAPQ